MKIRVFLTLLAFVASLYAVAVVYAQDGQTFPTDDDVNAIAKKLYCPVCPNTPLDVCETKACQDWRQQIREELAAGWNEQQIISYFVAQYGERVLAEPQRGGFSSLVWVLPVVAAALGLAVVWQVLKSWRVRRAQQAVATAATAQIVPDVLARIEQELQQIK